MRLFAGGLAMVLIGSAGCYSAERARLREELAAQNQQLADLQALLQRLTETEAGSRGAVSEADFEALTRRYEDFTAKLQELEQSLTNLVVQYDALEAENQRLKAENARLKGKP